MIRFAIVAVGIAALPALAEAQGSTSADLVLAVAKVCANEASLGTSRPADCALIWQATRRHGATHSERLSWLRRHSHCVLTDREMSDAEGAGNCIWTRHLTRTLERPEGWSDDLPWEGRYRRRWRLMLAFVGRLVAGATPPGGWPCDVDPDTWGGPMDRIHAQQHGMVPLYCRGTLNEGYRRGGG